MNRKERLNWLASLFPRDYVVAQNPDHPSLVDGPDIVAGSRGHLVAIFAPKVREFQNARHLRDRLILSRLAMPEHTRYVLAVSAQDVRTDRLLRAAYHDFHAIVDDGYIRRTRSTILEHDLGQTGQTIRDVLRQAVYEKFGCLLSLYLAHT